MTTTLSIGDFSRMTYLSVKALRYYHDVGLLPPASVDPATGYRRYQADQVPAAQVIRRLRDLHMPLDEIRAVLRAPDVPARNAAILGHLQRMERQLADARSAVSSLRRLLEASPSPIPVDYRSYPAMPVLGLEARIAMDDFDPWWAESFSQLHAVLARSSAQRSGPDGALYYQDYFTSDVGRVVAFVPVARPVPGHGRIQMAELPAGEFAVATHAGGLDLLDLTYGALGRHVAEHELGVEGPIRETYLTSAFDTPDETRHRTEVGWPIFQTAPAGRARAPDVGIVR